MRWIVVAILVLFLAYWIVSAISPPAVGAWQDDAIYLATAKSLAEGDGYRLPHIPVRPYQTKYPIGYPAILAMMWALYPRYPQNLPLLLAPGAAAAAGFVVLSAVVVRKVLGASRRMSVAVGVLAAMSPEMLSGVRFTMSDLVFAFFSVAAVWCLDGKYASASAPARRGGWLAAAALLVAAAAMTRTFGVALWAAAVAMLLLRRRWTAAGVMVVLVAVCLLPWQLWRSWAVAQNAALATGPLDAYALNYWLWLPKGVGDALRVVVCNFFKTVFATGYVQLALPRSWTGEAISAVSWRLVALHAICWSAAILVTVGFLARGRRGWKTLHLYAVAYLAMMLLWPFDPSRFLDCWIPFIFYFLLAGAVGLSRWTLRRRIASASRGRGLVLLPAGAIVVVVAVLFITEDHDILLSSRSDYSFMREGIDLTASDRLYRWITANTAAGDVLASNHTAELYLATGRVGHDFGAWSDPVAAYYGRDRQWWRFFTVHSSGEFQWLYDWACLDLERTYRQAGVTHYIDDTDHPMAVVMRRFIYTHPQLFQPVFATGPIHPTYRVYRFTPPETSTASK